MARVFDTKPSPTCYTLTTVKDQEYLIRASFPSGGRAGPEASFYVVVGETVVGLVDSAEDAVVEGVFRAKDDVVDFCLVQEKADHVYISSIELRPLDGLRLVNEEESRVLRVVHRIDLGGSGETRFPDDQYDRIWKSSRPEPSPVLTLSSIIPGRNAASAAPLKVLRTAAVDPNRLDFSHIDLDKGDFTYTLTLYFIELDENVSIGERVFDIYTNGEKKLEKFDILADGSNYKEVNFRIRANGYLKFSLVKVPNGFDFGPICNGYEIFQFRPWIQLINSKDVTLIGMVTERGRVLSSNPDYVSVMKAVRKDLLISNRDSDLLQKNWSGDPCFDHWEGVACDNNSSIPAIIRLDLSCKGLRGLIPLKITTLTHLQYLDLSSNHFDGTIPNFPPDFNETSIHVGCNLHLMPGNSSDLSIDYETCRCKSESWKHNLIIIISVCGAVLLLVLVLGTLFCIRRRKRMSQRMFIGKRHQMKNNLVFNIPSSIESVFFKPPKLRIQNFLLEEIDTITEKYKTKIGEGGFGVVYRGTLPDGHEVAVKVHSATSTQGTKEFKNELTLLSDIRHENLVPLLGVCQENDQQILVYPYMSNGSLQDRLYGEAAKRKVLDWPTRLSIALGSARGLLYLHTFSRGCVIHRDVKSSNILMDHSMCAKVADFGFSKYAPQEGDSGVSLEVRGTAGYLDPEYYSSQQLSAKSDVYSFGVVLLEIVSGREPLNIKRPREEWSLVEWAKTHISESRIDEIVDPNIKGGYHAEAMWRVVEVALTCIEPLSANRPSMDDIVRELEDALIIENNASEYMRSIDSLGGSNRFGDKMLVLPSIPSPMEPSPISSTQPIAPPEPR